jgi:hypothetical protein
MTRGSHDHRPSHSKSDATRRLLQIDAKPEHTHERTVSPPAVGLRRVTVGLGGLRAASDSRSLACRSRRLNEHAHGCAEARTNRRRAPLVAAGHAERRLENRRRHDPGQDRLTERRANVRTEGEIEVPSSRRRPEPKPEPSLAHRAKNDTHFSRLLCVGPRRAPRDQSRQRTSPGVAQHQPARRPLRRPYDFLRNVPLAS